MAITYHSGSRIQGEAIFPYYTQTGTQITVGSNISINCNADGNHHGVSYNLGSTVSDTVWKLQFDVTTTTQDLRSSTPLRVGIGLSSTDGTFMDNQDGIFIGWNMDSGGDKKLYGFTPNNSELDAAADTVINYAPLNQGKIYYTLERISSSDYKVTIRSGSHTGTVLETDTMSSASGSTGLQYLKVVAKNTNDSGAHLIAVIDSMVLYNAGSSTPMYSSGDIKPTNVPLYSRFEETDTRKIFTKLPYFTATTGLMAYYKFDEASGNLINQAAAVGSTDEIAGNGSNTGVTYSVSGKIGNAYSYDGTNDFTTVNALHTSTTTSGSVFYWWNTPTFSGGNIMWSLGDANADEFIFVEFMTSNTSLNVFVRQAGSNKWVANTGTISNSTDTWHSFALTHNGTAPLLYVDGLETTNVTTTTDQTIWVNDLTGLDNGRIGCVNRTGLGNGDFYEGLIDELSYWGRALTAAEVLTLHGAGSGRAITSTSSWKEKGTT